MKEMVGGCCVCSDERGWDENPLVYCDGHGCNVAVHQACYGIVTVPVGAWYCRKCESQERAARVRCELCPQREGALKRTDNGSWCHVVCALFIPEAWFGDTTTMEPIILNRIPAERFNKSCYICEEQGREGKSTTGACMQCIRAGCKQHFHVTCAQAQGLLGEMPRSGNKTDVKYVGFCSYHYKKVKKDPNMKVYSAYKPLVMDGDSNQFSPEKPAIAGKPEKSKGQSSSSSVTLSQSSTSLKSEGKERVQVKGNASTVTSASGDTPPSASDSKPTLVTTLLEKPNMSANPAAKTSVVGKFTTANFVETTIVPSPANFSGVANTSTVSMATANTSSALSVTTTSVTLPSLDPSVRASSAALGSGAKHSESTPVPPVCQSALLLTTTAAPVVTTTPSTVSFSHTFRNFIGQNYGTPVDAAAPPPAAEPAVLSSPETPRGKKRQPRAGGEHAPKGGKRGKSADKSNGATGSGKAKTVKSLLEMPAATSPPTLSPVYASTLIPPAQRKSETKRAISNILSSLSPKSETEDHVLPVTSSHSAPTISRVRDHQVKSAAAPMDTTSPPSRLVGPPVPATLSVSASSAPPASTSSGAGGNSSTGGGGTSASQVPMTMEQLLERQWEQGSDFLMQQGQHFDIASLLSCLYQLKAENRTLEERIATMTARRDHLLAVNARLSVPLASPLGNAAVHPTPPGSGAPAVGAADVDSHHHSQDNGLSDDPAAQLRQGKSPRSNASLANFTNLRDSGIGLGHLAGGPSPLGSSSGPSRGHSDLYGSLMQPGALSASLLQGASGVVPPASAAAGSSGGRGSLHPSPAKKARVTSAAATVPSVSLPLAAASQIPFSMPVLPPGSRPPVTGAGDPLGFFSRDPAAMEQLHRQQQMIQQQMLLAAAGSQLTPEHQTYLLQQLTQQRMNAMSTPPGSLASALPTPPHHQRTPPSSSSGPTGGPPGHHAEKMTGGRKDKS